MQLTVDTGAPLDIEFKMTTIKGVTLNEKITKNVEKTFSDDVKSSCDIVKDLTNDMAQNNDESKEIQLNDKIVQDENIASTTEIEKSISKKTSIEDSEILKSSTNEQDKPEDIVTNHNSIDNFHDSDSQNRLSNHNVENKENENIVTDEKSENGSNEHNVKFIVQQSEVRDEMNDDKNISTKVEENTTNDSTSDTEEITIKANDILENDEKVNSDTKTEISLPESACDEVCNKADDMNEQSLKNITESQSHDNASPILPKTDNNENKAIESEIAAVSTLEKTENSTKECEITEESVASAKADTKDSTIVIEDEKINEVKSHDSENESKNAGSKVVEEKKESTLISKLTNILDLLSDDEEEHQVKPTDNNTSDAEKQCISLVDDDDVMLIDEDSSLKRDANTSSNQAVKVISEASEESTTPNEKQKDEDEVMDSKQELGAELDVKESENMEIDNKINEIKENNTPKPLLSLNFLNTCKKKLADMTREDLEDFCSLKIVESVMDRSNLGDLKTQLKAMAVTIEEFKKKTNLLSKQNRDLQVVLKSVQEEQKKSSGTALTPLKITRSVGMQVLMTDKPNIKRKNAQIINSSTTPTQPSSLDKTNRNSSQKVQKAKNQSIPVPRLVPAANNSNKTSPAPVSNTCDSGKSSQVPALINGVRNSPPVQKPEKRTRVQSVTVDLTDDEPPLKVTAKNSPAPGVRLVPAQNLLPPQRPQFVPAMSSPRKVYIPISGPQSQNVRPGQALMLKTVPPTAAIRPRPPANNGNKVQSNAIRMNRPVSAGRHPAPLPDAVKQYQPTSWKALPPAPDLKLSKVENGIVISWKIDGYQEDSYEEITSYQLFAYQETSCPPSTALWKKIGDVKALPLPMACTLTQFLAGYKYYFAVRAVDIKSRFGPFSLPASILLLNKM